MKKKNLSTIQIEGLNQERAINKLCKSVKIYNFLRSGKSVSQFDLKNRDINKAKSLLSSEGLSVKIVRAGGVQKLAQICKRLTSVFVAAAIAITLYFLQLGFIWQVKIYGNSVISTEEITTFIRSSYSMQISRINTKKIEIDLKNKFNRISSISVAIIGQSLVINIYESLLPSEMAGNFSPIYSNFDGKITEINLVQGTPVVKVGQIVRRGDVLVEPYIFDSHNEKKDVKADAEIKAEVWLTGHVTHYDIAFFTTRTGRKRVSSYVVLFGVPLYTNATDCDFEQFETEEREQYLTKNNILPLKIVQKTYYETKTTYQEQNFDEVKSQKIEEARQKALILLRDYEIIKDERYSIVSQNGITVVSCIITVERQIGVENEDLFPPSAVQTPN